MPGPSDLPADPSRLVAGEDRPLAAVGWMVLTGLFFVAVITIVKFMGDRIPAPQSAFLRYALGLVFFVPFWPALRQARLGRRELGQFGLRGVIHAAGVACWFYAMTRITLAEVTAMNYLNPIGVTLGAALFLGERLQIRRILAVVVALLGALLILRPGLRPLDPGHIAMLGCAVSFAGSYLFAKVMSGTHSAVVVVAGLSIVVTLALAPAAIAVWVAPTPVELALLLLVAAFATAGHYTMTLAFAAGPLAVSQPVTFLQLVWSVVLGAALFGEAADPFVIAGGTIILGSVTFIAWREARLRAQAQTQNQGHPPATGAKGGTGAKGSTPGAGAGQ